MNADLYYGQVALSAIVAQQLTKLYWKGQLQGASVQGKARLSQIKKQKTAMTKAGSKRYDWKG
jgi:hypothetical protein